MKYYFLLKLSNFQFNPYYYLTVLTCIYIYVLHFLQQTIENKFQLFSLKTIIIQ